MFLIQEFLKFLDVQEVLITNFPIKPSQKEGRSSLDVNEDRGLELQVTTELGRTIYCCQETVALQVQRSLQPSQKSLINRLAHVATDIVLVMRLFRTAVLKREQCSKLEALPQDANSYAILGDKFVDWRQVAPKA
ncbi:hypothetical protein AVEN_37458-1 [Araneus ventricosus]|uniref:Uncharacterized protein n=1 Tax=Araneus ventricosus TaxID=182803 RepID=A0A4Y2FBH4_ARAVE|nr:hypothetical protein AVEN_37458-1 [Araneus ventricosus]